MAKHLMNNGVLDRSVFDEEETAPGLASASTGGEAPNGKKQRHTMPEERLMDFQREVSCQMNSTMQAFMTQMMEMQKLQNESLFRMMGASQVALPAPQALVVEGAGASMDRLVTPTLPTTSTTDPLDDEETVKKLNQIRNKFGKKVRTYLRAVDTQRKRAADAKVMVDDASWTKYPHGMRPFKASPTEIELDECWSKCVDGEFKVEIVFPRGTSMRKVAEGLHHQTTKIQKMINLEASELKVKTLHVASRKGVFVKSCHDIVNELFSNAAMNGLGLEEPIRPAPLESAVTARAEQLYLQVLDKVAADKKEEDAKCEKDEKEKKKEEEKLLNSKPELLLSNLVNRKVRRAAKTDDDEEESASGDGETGEGEEKEIEDCRKIVAALAANKAKFREAPIKKPPPWEKGAGKTKSSWRTEGKQGGGKAKGSKAGWTTDKGKGKGSGKGGKGKGKPPGGKGAGKGGR